MTKTQCISVTELRNKTKQCLTDLENEPKYIFVNNKPVAVIVHIEDYEELCSCTELVELNKDQVGKELIQKAKEAKKLPKSELTNI